MTRDEARARAAAVFDAATQPVLQEFARVASRTLTPEAADLEWLAALAHIACCRAALLDETTGILRRAFRPLIR